MIYDLQVRTVVAALFFVQLDDDAVVAGLSGSVMWHQEFPWYLFVLGECGQACRQSMRVNINPACRMIPAPPIPISTAIMFHHVLGYTHTHTTENL